MAVLFGNALSATLERLVRWVIVPVTSVIPLLVSSGLLLLGFAAMWVAFFAAMIAAPTALDAAWQALGALPLVLQAVAWLLLLPLTAGLWVWATDWPLIVRIVLVAGIAGWNLLVFIPRREATAPAATL
jgi:hypothetical protein